MKVVTSVLSTIEAHVLSTQVFLSCDCILSSLVPRPSSTFTFGGPGMPNQMFEWVGPRQRYCTQCHYDNFLGTPTATYSLLEKSGAASIIGEWLPGSVSC